MSVTDPMALPGNWPHGVTMGLSPFVTRFALPRRRREIFARSAPLNQGRKKRFRRWNAAGPAQRACPT